MAKNYCVKFASRPGPDSPPCPENFLYTECDYPVLDENGKEDVSLLLERFLYAFCDWVCVYPKDHCFSLLGDCSNDISLC